MRLNEQRFLILVALSSGPLHGYAIAEEIKILSSGHLAPLAGSLYHALDKLVDASLISVSGEETVDGRLRRNYQLTGTGTEVVAEEAARRSACALAALDRLGVAAT